MRLGDGPIGVDALGGAADHGLEVIAEVDRLEIGIELLRGQVAEILGVVGTVVAADAPGELVLGQVSRNELDGIEGIRLAGLSGGQDPGVDGFLGDLVSRKVRNLWFDG